MKGNNFWSTWIHLAAIVALVTAIVLVPGPATANGFGNLNRSFRVSLNGGVVSAGVGLRGIGSGEVTISGIPAGATVYRAFLYWATIGNSSTFTSPIFQNTQVNGNLIGYSGNTCWVGAERNFVYRADVTALVGGNGTYSVSQLPDNLDEGNDSQGASLVVIYSANDLPHRTIIIQDGAVTLDIINNTHTEIITGYSVDDPITDAEITYLIGDGQSRWDTGNVLFNGTSIASNIFTGADGDFWGTHTINVTTLAGESPATTTINNADPDNPNSPDCLLWAGVVFSITSAPPVEGDTGLDQSFNFLLHGDVTADGVGLRGTGTGEIPIAGIPVGAYVNHAFLYWATIGNSDTYTSPTLNDAQVNGELIGVSDNTCWEGAEANFAYRANVTQIVQETGNGTYTIAGLPNNLAEGNDSQGASLVVIYTTSPDQPLRSVVISDGAVTLDREEHSYTATLTDFSTDSPVRQADITYIVGDGQSAWDSGNVTVDGTSIAQNIFTGVDGEYWGTITIDVTALQITSTVSTTVTNIDPENPDSPDCIVWVATVLSVTAPQPNYQVEYYLPIAARMYP